MPRSLSCLNSLGEWIYFDKNFVMFCYKVTTYERTNLAIYFCMIFRFTINRIPYGQNYTSGRWALATCIGQPARLIQHFEHHATSVLVASDQRP